VSEPKKEVPLDAPGSCSRRALLRCGAAAACAPALAQLAGCAPHISEAHSIDLPAPVGTGVTGPRSRVPEMLTLGSSLILRPDVLDDQGRPAAILAVKSSKIPDNGGLLAFNAYCPHAGCEVAWDDANTQVVCPCHLSRFAADGTVLHPPALDNLEPYVIKIQGSAQTLTVDMGGLGGIFPAAVGGVVTFTLQDLPALAKPGGSATGHAAGVKFPLLVIRTGANTVQAFDARCPHLGCAVYGAQQLLICKCHGSLFTLDGSVKLGPAQRPLKALPVTFDGTTAVVRTA